LLCLLFLIDLDFLILLNPGSIGTSNENW